MKKLVLLFFAIVISSIAGFSFVNPMVDNEHIVIEDALSERIVGYDISAKIDVNSHIITGKEKVFWYNNTKKSINVLKFHLYMNGFSSIDTQLMQGAKKMGLLNNHTFSEETSGYIVVNSIEVNFTNLTDDFKVDGTIATLELPYNINPGESIILNIGFVTKLPRIAIRAGYADSFHLIGQWFPKLGVLNEFGDWECNKYIVNGEFFSDFGVYKCSLSFPKNFTLVGTGQKISEKIEKETKTVTHYAEDVHDIAFALWDKFKNIEKVVLGKKMVVYFPSGHEKLAKRIMNALEKAFVWYSENLREYPYPDYKVIDVPFNALGAGGMEYETFSTTVALNSLPDYIRLPEKVTIHEFGHAYFQGMAANNESDEGWLDEGLNTYMTAMLMDKFYGECSLIDSKVMCRGSFDSLLNNNFESLKYEYPSLSGANFVTSNGYSKSVYSKTALLLKTIENYLGRDVVINTMSRYLNEFSFRQPKGTDFINILNEETGGSFKELINSIINSEFFPDAMVLSVNSYKKEGFKGFVSKDKKMMYLQESKSEKKIEHEVVFGKRELPISMNYKIILSNGNEIQGVMMGDETIKKVSISTPENVNVVEAWIDYDKKAFIDLDRENNRFNKSQVEIIKPVAVSIFFIIMEWIGYVF